MLGYIRESVQGWIAWAIVILLIIPFALWGINEYFGTGGPLVVATVNGEEVSQQTHQREFYMQRDRMRQMLGAQFDPSVFDDQLKKKALTDIINREVLIQTAQDSGFRISENFLVSTIQSFEAFQVDGKFSNDVYKQQLSAQSESPSGFENRMHRAILSQQLYSGIATTPLVTRHDIDYVLRLQEQTREIGYLILDANNYKKVEDATEEVINQYYKDHSDRYMTPEMVSLQYIELNAADLNTEEEPTEEDLRKFYEERSSIYVVPEERRSSHIMLMIEPGATPEQIDAVKTTATELHKQIKDGADFAKLAKEKSEDPGSNQLGGDMGLMGRGKTPDPAYEEALFNLAQVGDVSEPVLSAFGYHIIKLDGINAQKTKPFEEVKADLVAEYKQGITDRLFFDLSDKLTNLAYEVPDTLEDASGGTGLKIKETGFFPKAGGAGIASNPKVAALAYGDDVLKNRYNSEPIEIGDNHVVVIRIKEHKEASLKTLQEVTEQIKAQIIDEKAQERAKSVGLNIIEQLAKGEATPVAAAKIANVEWKKAGELKRTDRTIETKIVQHAFKMTKPAEGKSSFSGAKLATGNFAVVGVSKVTDGDVEQIEEAKRTTLARNISGIHGETAFASFLEDLKESAEIVVNEDNL